MKEKPTRKDKWFHLGPVVFHYIHYYPSKLTVTSTWGWTVERYQGQLSIDFLLGKHTIVWVFSRNHG